MYFQTVACTSVFCNSGVFCNSPPVFFAKVSGVFSPHLCVGFLFLIADSRLLLLLLLRRLLLPQLTYTTHLTQLISHNSSHTTHLPQLHLHYVTYTTHLPQLTSHNSSHTTPFCEPNCIAVLIAFWYLSLCCACSGLYPSCLVCAFRLPPSSADAAVSIDAVWFFLHPATSPADASGSQKRMLHVANTLRLKRF